MEEKAEVFLITGSSGYLGHALCHHFATASRVIVGFDRVGPPDPPPPVECLFCDLTSDESVQKTFHLVHSRYGNKIKAVFHLAAYYDFSGADSHLYKDLTVDGTDRILRELKNFEVGQFIFSSSMLVHKPNEPGHPLTEESPVEPSWQYPNSKIETEKLLKEKHGKIPIVILRIAGVYDDICNSIPLAHQIQRIYENQLEGHLYPGNVKVRQSFVHISDVVNAYELVVQKAAQLPGESVFLIGEPDAMSYDELQHEISRQLDGDGWTTFDVPKPLAKAGAWVEENVSVQEKPFIRPWMIDHADDYFELDISKTCSVLGWEPQNSLRKTLPRMIEGLKVDPKRWYQINKLHFPLFVPRKGSSKAKSK
jgi:nucleoside-diphosphate-sugar epimerase